MTILRDIKIGILAGGPSSEREISLRSGNAVLCALKNAGYNAELYDLDDKPCEFLEKVDMDVAFIALHGGFGEDGTIQKILEDLHVPYTGSDSLSSYSALDKLASKRLFDKYSVPTPKYISVDKKISFSYIKDKCKLPVVIKPATEGSSVGLSVVRKQSQFEGALKAALKYSKHALIEEYITGRELTVGILDGKSLPVVEIIAKDSVYDYNAKYVDKGTVYVVPAKINEKQSEEAKKTAVAAHKALGCRDFSRVDIRMDGHDNMFVLEVNTIPGLTERSLLPKAAQAAGMSFTQLCEKFVELALKKAEL